MSTWSVPIQYHADRMIARTEGRARRTILNLFTAIIKRSPIATGRFVSNWNITAGLPNYSYTNSTNISRALYELDKVLSLPIDNGLYIANGLPYAELLEYAGLSRQAPAGMIRISVAELSMHART